MQLIVNKDLEAQSEKKHVWVGMPRFYPTCQIIKDVDLTKYRKVIDRGERERDRGKESWTSVCADGKNTQYSKFEHEL